MCSAFVCCFFLVIEHHVHLHEEETAFKCNEAMYGSKNLLINSKINTALLRTSFAQKLTPVRNIRTQFIQLSSSNSLIHYSASAVSCTSHCHRRPPRTVKSKVQVVQPPSSHHIHNNPNPSSSILPQSQSHHHHHPHPPLQNPTSHPFNLPTSFHSSCHPPSSAAYTAYPSHS